MRATVIAVACFSVFVSPSFADDDCEDAGKLGVMLGHIDMQCPGYRLTAAGRRVMLHMADKVQPLAGRHVLSAAS